MKVLFTILLSFILSSLFAQDTIIESKNKNLADSVYSRLIKGESFATLAMLYSQDRGSLMDGGEYKTLIKSKHFLKAIRQNIKNLPINEISKPFKSQYGWHIVEVIERKGNKVRIRHILINTQPIPEPKK